MTASATGLVRKLWQYCNILRDDGLSYPDYVEQLTYLLFLKMADEQSAELVPAAEGWRSFATLDASDMCSHYQRVLERLGEQSGILGLIFRGARNKIRDPHKLRYLVVELVGQTEWTGLSPDVKGDAYEGLLEKNARDTKSGAGQYFTPRALVEAIVECVDPRPVEVICDPACGTGGFLLAARDHVERTSDGSPMEAHHLRTRALRGVELVQEVARLAAMNLYLHGIADEEGADVPIRCDDSLRQAPVERVDIVLTNPPFGTKGSVSYGADKSRNGEQAERTVVRSDFWVRTANKQLNFLQHTTSLLKDSGRAAVIVPDNVLFESGAAAAIRRRLLEDCDVHTLLRLPAGLFYATGLLANVLFFDARPAAGSRRSLWVYDLRTTHRYSLKTNPLRRTDLDEFVGVYRPGAVVTRREDESPARWRAFPHDELLADENCRLDLRWELDLEHQQTEANGLARIDAIGLRIAEDLRRALAHFSNVAGDGDH